MAVQVINQIQTRPINKSTPYALTEYIGLSTDTKPVDCSFGSVFEELDTNGKYKFDGIEWYPISNASTEIAIDGTPYNTVLDLFNLENYKGKVFTFSKTNIGVANNGYFDLRIKAGTKMCFLEILYSSEGKAYFKTYLNSTYTANGTIRVPFPRNSGSTQTLLTTVYETPTVQTLGTIRGDDFIGIGGNVQTQAGGSKSVSGTILAPNHDLLIRLQNVAGAVKDLNLIINILEF